MPIYEYSCEDCGTKFEKLVRRQGDEVLCPSCGQAHLKTELPTFAAHAGGAKGKSSDLPPCAGGMCPTPGLCGSMAAPMNNMRLTNLLIALHNIRATSKVISSCNSGDPVHS